MAACQKRHHGRKKAGRMRRLRCMMLCRSGNTQTPPPCPGCTSHTSARGAAPWFGTMRMQLRPFPLNIPLMPSLRNMCDVPCTRAHTCGGPAATPISPAAGSTPQAASSRLPAASQCPAARCRLPAIRPVPGKSILQAPGAAPATTSASAALLSALRKHPPATRPCTSSRCPAPASESSTSLAELRPCGSCTQEGGAAPGRASVPLPPGKPIGLLLRPGQGWAFADGCTAAPSACPVPWWQPRRQHSHGPRDAPRA